MTDPEQLPQNSEEPEEYIQKIDPDQINEEYEESENWVSLTHIDECREMPDFLEAQEGGIKSRRGLHILKVPKMFNPPPPPEEK